MRIYRWIDRRQATHPRAVIQRGDCASGNCEQFAISISDGQIGMTVRFDSEQEYRAFLERGEIAIGPSSSRERDIR